MSVLASSERIANGQIVDLKNQFVQLIDRVPGRIIHGYVTRIPEDAAFDEIETGLIHARTYHIQPPKHADPNRPQEPCYVIREENVDSISISNLSEMPARAVVWLGKISDSHS